jgi:hypothetical protein
MTINANSLRNWQRLSRHDARFLADPAFSRSAPAYADVLYDAVNAEMTKHGIFSLALAHCNGWQHHSAWRLWQSQSDTKVQYEELIPSLRA